MALGWRQRFTTIRPSTRCLRFLTSAAVQFFNQSSTGGSYDATLRLYEAGAPVGSQIGPSYSLSGLSIGGFDISTVTFTGLNVVVPDNLVFTVEVSAVSLFLDLGLNLFQPPSIGSSDSSAIITRDGSSFASSATAAGDGNLYLKLEAVPESASVAGLAGLVLLAAGLGRMRRYSKLPLS